MLKHRIIIFPGHDPDVVTDEIKADFRGLTWWAVTLPERPLLLINQESGYVALVQGDYEDDLMAMACAVMDAEDLVPAKGAWGERTRSAKDSLIGISHDIPMHVQHRFVRVEELITEYQDQFALAKAIDRLNKTEPIEIGGKTCMPEDGLVEYLNRIQDAHNDYMDHTNLFVWLWDLITQKRPWMAPDYKMRGKR